MRYRVAAGLCPYFLWIALSISAGSAPATGPLRPLKNNPHYFTDGSGKAIYLAGSHNWHNFQDNGHRLASTEDPPPRFDYNAYLDFLAAHHHNFFRLWRWEAPKWTDAQPKGAIKYCEPHPWMRTGPGAAQDGKPKFDLTRFNPEYFDRMRDRIIVARDRGIYVSIMLFEGWELQFTDAWTYHPFNRANNVNDVDADADADGRGTAFNRLVNSPMGKRVLALQQAYLRKIIDTVDDLDNVLYEVCNEAAGSSTPWQYRVIEYVKKYESTKAKQHPVGMTYQYPSGANALLYNSPADWVSPNPGDPEERFRDNPWPARPDKVIVNDTDHLWGHTGGDSLWVWKSFTRGLNVLFMEELLPSPTWQDSARGAMGQTRQFAEKINLAEMMPSRDLSNTTYCLASRGKEYLVFQWDHGEFTVNLTDAPGTFAAEWFNIATGATIPAQPVTGGSVRTFTTPFGGPAVLYLKRR
jgi:uncharacterized protein DUF6298/collagenase-like protein with putative collagen-binding domain